MCVLRSKSKNVTKPPLIFDSIESSWCIIFVLNCIVCYEKRMNELNWIGNMGPCMKKWKIAPKSNTTFLENHWYHKRLAKTGTLKKSLATEKQFIM